MNEQMDEWLKKKASKKKNKHACILENIRIIMYKIKAENNIKKRTNKQERPLTLQLTGIVEKPRENSEMCENVKVSNN